MPADGQAVAQVEIGLVDAQGRPTALDEEIFLQVAGDGALLGIENGRPDDLTPYAEQRRRTLDGRAIAYIRAGRLKGGLTLHAFTRGGLQAACTIALSE